MVIVRRVLAPLHGPDERLEDRYTVGETIGDGGYGMVKTVVKKDTQQVFALKISETDSYEGMLMLKREFACHKACHDHPNICRVYEAFQLPNNGGLQVRRDSPAHTATGASLSDRRVRRL